MSMSPIAYLVDRQRNVSDHVASILKAADVPMKLVNQPQTGGNDASNSLGTGCMIVATERMSSGELEWIPGLVGPQLPPCIVVANECGVSEAVRAMQMGTHHVMTQPIDVDEFVASVRSAMTLSVNRRKEDTLRSDIRTRLSTLTVREREVTGHVVKGVPNKIIAVRLKLSEKTVEVHRAHAMKKMQAGSLAELVRMIMLIGGLNSSAVESNPTIQTR